MGLIWLTFVIIFNTVFYHLFCRLKLSITDMEAVAEAIYENELAKMDNEVQICTLMKEEILITM